MKNCGYYYYNGKSGRLEDCALPLSDRSIFFADAVYDVAIGNNGVIFQYNEHIERLKKSADSIGLKFPTPEVLYDAAKGAVEMYGNSPFVIYLQLSGYGASRAHQLRSDIRSNLLITVTDLKFENEYPLKLNSAKDLRHELCNVKTTNLLYASLTCVEATRKGFDETVFLKDGMVTECSHSNVYILRDGVVYTHPEGPHILSGITRSNVKKHCRGLGIKFEETLFTYEDLLTADSVFISSTTKFIRQADSVDKNPIRTDAKELISLLNSKIIDDFHSTCNKF